ncbi:MAG: hypothetical protein GY762_02420 [Proteobacteria bacterium]|nr:hypothetical protein [Pseudomonadota bacterium]
MTFDTGKELKNLYTMATLHREAAKTFSGDEWKEFQKIRKDTAELKRFEQRAFELEYKTRVGIARKRLINKAGEKNKDFKHKWFGSDGFDKAAIDSQAQKIVRGEHQKLMTHIDAQEVTKIESLADRSSHRKSMREKPKRDFTKAADRRKGAERRQKDKGPAHRRSPRRIQ